MYVKRENTWKIKTLTWLHFNKHWGSPGCKNCFFFFNFSNFDLTQGWLPDATGRSAFKHDNPLAGEFQNLIITTKQANRWNRCDTTWNRLVQSKESRLQHYPLKAQWLFYVPPRSTFKNSTLSTECIYTFHMDLRTNSDCFPTESLPIGFLQHTQSVFTARYELNFHA
jgi:hypothetical protein